jgi:hypothetical protein
MISRLLPDLRAQLAAVINNPTQQQQQQQPLSHNGVHLHSHNPHGYDDAPRESSSASPRNIDPAIAHHHEMMSGSPGGDSGGEDNGLSGDGRKGGKRELSQSKRAAQNRAAQVCSIVFEFLLN